MKTYYTLGFNYLKTDHDFGWRFCIHYLNPMTYFRFIKYFCQRGFYGHADNDALNADGYLECVIYSLVKELKKVKDGFPVYLSDYDFGEEEDPNKPDTGYDKMLAILQEILDGLEASEDLRNETTIPDGVYSDEEHKYEKLENGNYRVIDDGIERFNIKLYDEWAKPLQVKQKRAMLLICKYWDHLRW